MTRESVRLINGGLVRARRLEMGLSQRALARTAGFGLATLTDIENHDGQDRQVTIVELVRLAGALDISPARLVELAPEEPQAAPPVHDDDDAQQVSHVLLEVRVIVAVDDVAQALGWTYDRASNALDALNSRLAGTGLHVHRFAGRVQLRPVDPAPDLTARAANVVMTRRGMSRPQAAQLYAVLQGSGKNGRRGEPGDKRGRPTAPHRAAQGRRRAPGLARRRPAVRARPVTPDSDAPEAEVG